MGRSVLKGVPYFSSAGAGSGTWWDSGKRTGQRAYSIYSGPQLRGGDICQRDLFHIFFWMNRAMFFTMTRSRFSCIFFSAGFCQRKYFHKAVPRSGQRQPGFSRGLFFLCGYRISKGFYRIYPFPRGFPVQKKIGKSFVVDHRITKSRS